MSEWTMICSKCHGPVEWPEKCKCEAQSELPATAGSARWERSEYPHPKFPAGMKLQPLPDVIWLRIHGDEVTGWQKKAPNGESSDRSELRP